MDIRFFYRYPDSEYSVYHESDTNNGLMTKWIRIRIWISQKFRISRSVTGLLITKDKVYEQFQLESILKNKNIKI